jgi:ADP-ribosylglycohydrolase
MVFITNYGRDNDTAGSIAGAILGASVGYEGLPLSMRKKTVEINKKELEIDLKQIARRMTKHYISSE